MLTRWGIQTGFGSSTPTPGQDAASAESLENLPTLMPDLPWLLISTDGPALGQSPGPPAGPADAPQVLAPTPLRPAGCAGGPWAQPVSPTRGLLGHSAVT